MLPHKAHNVHVQQVDLHLFQMKFVLMKSYDLLRLFLLHEYMLMNHLHQENVNMIYNEISSFFHDDHVNWLLILAFVPVHALQKKEKKKKLLRKKNCFCFTMFIKFCYMKNDCAAFIFHPLTSWHFVIKVV